MNVNYSTKKSYSKNYLQYISSTLNIDMTEHYNHFIKYLKNGTRILDIGFGSGRDLIYFNNSGYSTLGIDNVEEFVINAKNIGLNVELCDFHNMSYTNSFDGIWACGSLLHSDNLPLAFENVSKALHNNGYAYISMKYGSGVSIENDKFYQYIDEGILQKLCDNANLFVEEIYYSNDLLKRNQTWLNAILKKH